MEAMRALQKHIEQYRIDNLRDEVRDDIEECKEDAAYRASKSLR